MKEEGGPINFAKKLVKVGNSLCIRVPKNALEYLEVSEGDILDITLKKPVEEHIPEKLLLPYKKHFKELKDFSLSDINSCLFLFGVENTLWEDEENIRKVTEEFETNVRKERGEKFLKKYRTFKKILTNKKAMKKVVKDSMTVSEEFKKSIEISAGK